MKAIAEGSGALGGGQVRWSSGTVWKDLMAHRDKETGQLLDEASHQPLSSVRGCLLLFPRSMRLLVLRSREKVKARALDPW